jgi:uncharacterized protein YjiS (DUF1127 family)
MTPGGMRLEEEIMAQVRTATFGVATRGSRSTSFGEILTRVMDTVLTWQQREFDRAALASMSDRVLKDVGLTRADIEREWRKPFWRA